LSRGGKWLAGHLRRLCRTHEGLAGRLRETDAVAVGQSVAHAVREAVSAVLADGVRGPGPTHPDRLMGGPSLWGRHQDTDPDRWPDDPDPYDDELPPEPPDEPGGPGGSTRPSPWLLGVVLACQAAAWWVRRRLAGLPVLAAVAVGLLAALAAYAGGPLTLAGVGLAGSALTLAGTAEALSLFGSG
jgi:hypothetical protein